MFASYRGAPTHIAIVYDSIFGNTAQIAKAIASQDEAANTVQLLNVADARSADFTGIDLLIVSSLTRGFRPTPTTAEFVEGLPANVGAGKRGIASDTRMSLDDIHPAPLRWVVDAGGYAADRIDTMLKHKGFEVIGMPAGFMVGGTEGPLKNGEIERAKSWAAAQVS